MGRDGKGEEAGEGGVELEERGLGESGEREREAYLVGASGFT